MQKTIIPAGNSQYTFNDISSEMQKLVTEKIKALSGGGKRPIVIKSLTVASKTIIPASEDGMAARPVDLQLYANQEQHPSHFEIIYNERVYNVAHLNGNGQNPTKRYLPITFVRDTAGRIKLSPTKAGQLKMLEVLVMSPFVKGNALGLAPGSGNYMWEIVDAKGEINTKYDAGKKLRTLLTEIDNLDADRIYDLSYQLGVHASMPGGLDEQSSLAWVRNRLVETAERDPEFVQSQLKLGENARTLINVRRALDAKIIRIDRDQERFVWTGTNSDIFAFSGALEDEENIRSLERYFSNHDIGRSTYTALLSELERTEAGKEKEKGKNK